MHGVKLPLYSTRVVALKFLDECYLPLDIDPI
jgi:hypothetical protein